MNGSGAPHEKSVAGAGGGGAVRSGIDGDPVEGDARLGRGPSVEANSRVVVAAVAVKVTEYVVHAMCAEVG